MILIHKATLHHRPEYAFINFFHVNVDNGDAECIDSQTDNSTTDWNNNWIVVRNFYNIYDQANDWGEDCGNCVN